MKTLIKRAASLCTFLAVLLMSSVTFAASETDSMDDVIKYESVNYNIPGMALIIVENGNVIYDSVHGVADIEENIPLDRDNSVIQMGSFGKIITSLGLYQLMQDHGIADDSLIENYLIDAYLPDHDLTFKDLLQHSTGIPSIRQGTASEENPLLPSPSNFSDMASEFMTDYQHKHVVIPGEDTIYSNVGSVLAGLLIEALSNKPYEQYISESILSNFQMKTSADILSDQSRSNLTLARGYHVFGGEKTLQPLFKSNLIASDDFLTTTEDMSSFLKYMTTHQGDYQKFFTRQVGAYEDLLGRSYGFTISQKDGISLFLQDGGIPGETSRVFFLPSENLGVFIWYNSDETALRDVLTHSVLEIYAPNATKSLQYPAIEFNAGEYQDLMGAYTPVNISTETVERVTKIIRQIRVSEDSQGLIIDKQVYYPIGDMTFFNEENEQFARFIFDENHKLEYLVIDNTYYEYVGLFESLYFEIPMLAFATLFNIIALFVLLIRWQSLMVNRIHSTPRTVLLLESIFSALSIMLILTIAVNYNAWQVAYNSSSAMLWVKISGILTAVLYIPSWFMLRRGSDDFRWRGFTAFAFKMLMVFNAILVLWMWRYNFI